jgi:hypothetical protein
MKKIALLALFVSSCSAAPAFAQNCMPLADFARAAAMRGYEPVVQAKDSDGDKVIVALNPKTGEWVQGYIPASAPEAFCIVVSGTEFKVTMSGGI